jgi:hypothetical protein
LTLTLVPAWSALVTRLVRIVLFTLVAAWLPVTLHCKLEAAGFFAPHDGCAMEQSASVPGSDCRDDACPTVEASLYRETSSALKIVAPSVPDCFAWLAIIVIERTPRPEPTLSPARRAPPLELRVAWQFLSRAAPLARAPGCLA